ncbi:LacI family DNA-binding transcriptional regulator [Paracoccus sp. SCSIO 75233]|uniref:LacI family DNA-binding transcriptional regulator n=1 Tax=Paracoccus sp. SCSIO 75233 TaxID=3017782 RepID=UPI0022F06937|nr:LacI family DNA-binding transcriptional regulator [Paracoccus sp. SCSIO 75233]WBU52613.1 LacI family DNA-binding transcriptional regulator [Paracoccus sp. SCSIO 75233]
MVDQSASAAVRLSDVARHAGVSAATVSRVLSRPEMVSKATRDLVMEAVAATGYRINHAARNLRMQRTGAIVALVPNLSNPFFARILAGMGQALAEAGYDLLVGDTLADGDRRGVLRRFLDPSRADGIILLDGQVTQTDLSTLPGAPPLVMACEWIEGASLPRVVLDNQQGTAMAARHLRELGHSRIGCIGGPEVNVLHTARLEGLQQELGAPPHCYPGDFTPQGGVLAATAWLAADPMQRPTGIVAFSDESAAGFMGELQRHGVRIPDEVSVVGFDGIDWVAHLPVPLTTIRQPKIDLGSTAARVLLDHMRGEAPLSTILAPELLIRASSGPVPTH